MALIEIVKQRVCHWLIGLVASTLIINQVLRHEAHSYVKHNLMTGTINMFKVFFSLYLDFLARIFL